MDIKFLKYWSRQYDLIDAVKENENYNKPSRRVRFGMRLMELGKKIILKELNVQNSEVEP